MENGALNGVYTYNGDKTALLTPLIDSAKSMDEKHKEDTLDLPPLRNTRFNWLFLKRFVRILRILFPKFLSITLGFFIFFLFVRSSAEYNYYNTGLIPSKFYGSLTAKDPEDFKYSVINAMIVLISAATCKSAVDLVASILYVRWRSLLTSSIQRQYFDNLNYYKLNVLFKVVDNPDQRITQDVERFCNYLATQILPKLALWPFVTGYYTYKTFATMGYIGVLAIYGLFIVAAVINKFLMGPVVSLIVQQERREGDFRFQHVQVRSCAESIAFYNGGAIEKDKSRDLMGKLLKTQLSLAHWSFPLNFSVNLFDYFSSIITYAVLGILLFTGYYQELSPATISELSFFSLYLLNNFSTLVDQSSYIADLAGYTHRIGHLLEVLDKLNKKKLPIDENGSPDDSSNSDSENDSIFGAVVNDIDISPPHSNDESLLIEGLTFKFEKGMSILISGPSGCGKSSLLRVLKKLWKPVKGSTFVPEDTQVMFLPQKPLMTMGSLADQICYPSSSKTINEDVLDVTLFENRMNETITLCGLVSLKDRLGGFNEIFDGNWNDYVSPGEMQKIAFARIFYHKPSFAIIDEGTSSLSEEDEQYFYTTLQSMDISFMSVGHRSTIKQYHQMLLTLSGDGQWKLEPLKV